MFYLKEVERKIFHFFSNRWIDSNTISIVDLGESFYTY